MDQDESLYYRDLESAFAACSEPTIPTCTGCDDEVLIAGETCPACRAAIAEQLGAENAAKIAPAFRVMRMTRKGGFAQDSDGSWWKVRS